MVSGLITSPNDHDRISSGDASRTWMYSKSAARCSRVLGKSIIYLFLLAERDAQPESLQFFHQHVERLRNTGLGQVVALHDRLVHLRATLNVVRFHRQNLLQGMRGAVGLERPHLHLSETLAAKLGL